jgi:cell wall-associated NlpC family hydrolase
VHRSVLTGIFAFALSAGAFGVAAADEPSTVAPASVSRMSSAAGPSAAGPVAAAESSTDAMDAASPTAGADLAMWNAASPDIADSARDPATRHLSRLRRLASGIASRSSAIASSLTRSAMRFIGTPYVFGGTRATGFDCSGYVQHVFAMLGVHLPRTADRQFDAGHHIAAAIEPGDLVFFHTYAPGVSHVGIYLGHNKFIHSSSSHGVSISSLHDSYWAPRYLGAKRVFRS